jgi:hypothetical protein
MAATYIRSDNVVTRMIGGETLIVPVRNGVGDMACIYSLNGVATTLWNALAVPRNSNALVDTILQEFEVGAEKAREDLRMFLSEMESAGLVRHSETG